MRREIGRAMSGAMMGVLACAASAQTEIPSKVPISWNRYRDYPEMKASMEAIAAAYPELVTLKVVGRSREGRDMLVAVVNSSKTGPDTAKPAMWIDGNIHGNEVQAGEVVLYTLWYLTKSYGKNESITGVMDGCAFYLAPMMNPDGRQFWFDRANTPHSSRHDRRPMDHDRDGTPAEDSPDDLDGDGQITQMWKVDVRGRWVRSQTDDRVFVRLRDDQTAAAGVQTYQHLGEEGFDNDGDGRVNEDPGFGDDMNRNWPSDWQPEYVQGGSGPYPLSEPETSSIATFVMEHPNIAAAQSYHNTGGMILRPPGAQPRERLYPGEDTRVYDELARTGEQMLPYYRYMVIWRDLYRVYGGSIVWMAEGLGVYSFTNELWSTGKYFQRDGGTSEELERLWRDRMAFGELFSPYREFDHPQFGRVLVGGPNKWSSRVTPLFMLEEECHRNFAFTTYHADQLPRLGFGRVEVGRVRNRAEARVGDAGYPGLWKVRVEIVNSRLVPTRSMVARRERIGLPDLFESSGGAGSAARVIAVNQLSDWNDLSPSALTGAESREPGRILVPEGVPGRGSRLFELIVEGGEGQSLNLRYTSSWARSIEQTVELREPKGP
ncbi:MAG: peptidase M14 [Phycisphaerales bacterium]|nr:peptidase M14 [Phycisphaerales bacterium]